MVVIKFVCLVIGAYLLGGISVSRMITAHYNSDITKEGSGNPGTMNMLRNYGAKLGFITLFCDALKGAIPACVGRFLLFPGDEYLSIIALFVGGFAAVIGHMYPIFYNFSGGKGIATTIGTFAVANPLLALAIFVADFVFFLIVKIGSLASMFFIISFAMIDTFINNIRYNYVAMILMWLIVILDVFAHRSNFIRLFANEERLTSFKEGVKKDIARVQEKRLEKLDELKDKEKELYAKYDEKLLKKQQKTYVKKAKSLNRVNKKRVKLQQKYNYKIEEIKLESNEIIDYMQQRIDKRNEKIALKQSEDNKNDD